MTDQTAASKPENILREVYRELTDQEKAMEQEIRVKANALYELIHSFGISHELTQAKARITEAVIWAFAHIRSRP
jgi:hypothetical protein